MTALSEPNDEDNSIEITIPTPGPLMSIDLVTEEPIEVLYKDDDNKFVKVGVSTSYEHAYVGFITVLAVMAYFK